MAINFAHVLDIELFISRNVTISFAIDSIGKTKEDHITTTSLLYSEFRFFISIEFEEAGRNLFTERDLPEPSRSWDANIES